MHKVKVKITGKTPLSMGKIVMTEKLNKELPKDYEERTWREKLHYDENENVYVPLTMLKNCVTEAAKFLSIQIPGKGKATYTKHFEAGWLVNDHMTIGLKKADTKPSWVFVPADGKRGGSKRVWKCFPLIEKWEGVFNATILDDTITRDVFEQHVKEAGRFIGIGVFRPRNNGYYGRFEAEILSWE